MICIRSQTPCICQHSLQTRPSLILIDSHRHSDKGTLSSDAVLTNDALSEGGTLERGEAKVSDLDGASRAGDEDVVALEVAVDDGRGTRVQEVEALQDLTAPALQQLQLHLLEALQVPGTGNRKQEVGAMDLFGS